MMKIELYAMLIGIGAGMLVGSGMFFLLLSDNNHNHEFICAQIGNKIIKDYMTQSKTLDQLYFDMADFYRHDCDIDDFKQKPRFILNDLDNKLFCKNNDIIGEFMENGTKVYRCVSRTVDIGEQK